MTGYRHERISSIQVCTKFTVCSREGIISTKTRDKTLCRASYVYQYDATSVLTIAVSNSPICSSGGRPSRWQQHMHTAVASVYYSTSVRVGSRHVGRYYHMQISRLKWCTIRPAVCWAGKLGSGRNITTSTQVHHNYLPVRGRIRA